MELKNIETIRIKTANELRINLTDLKQFGYFLFCISGKGKIIADNKEIDLQPNSVINLITNSNIYIPESEQMIDAILIKYHNNVKEILSTHSMRIFCPVTGAVKIFLNQSYFSDILFYIKKIKKELQYNNNQVNEIVLLNLILTVKELSRNINIENTKRKITNKTILSFINLVDSNYQNNKNLDFYTDQMFITTKTLYRTFKDNLGISPKEFINFRLTMEAKKMIIHTNLSIKDISSNLGFQSQYNFTNFFKKNNNNTSPTEYKSAMSENHIILS